jgi:cold shock CspA family protein
MKQQHLIAVGGIGVVATIHPKGFGFIAQSIKNTKIRVYFHLADTDGTDFQVGDRVKFDVGLDEQNRTRAYNVQLIPTDAAVERG